MNDQQNTLRKAAILITSLEPQTARKLLAQMTPEQANMLREAAEMLGDVQEAEVDAVIDEFFRIGPMLPEDQPLAVEVQSRFPEREIESEFPTPTPDIDRPWERRRPNNQPFRFLHHTAGTTLGAKLRNEHPQTIAVVVSHLPPDRGAELLSSLPSSLQADVARRLVDLDEADPEILYEIEQDLEMWLQEQERSSKRRSAGMTALENILAAADPLHHEMMLANLARYDRGLASQLSSRESRTLAFAQLQELDDRSLARLLNCASPELVAHAMAGAGKAMVSRAFRLLPVARAARLRRDLDGLGPMRVSDVELAQQELAELARELERTGELSGSAARKLSIAI